jgi:hypothetical protein
MKHLLAILLLAACAVSAHGQTIKSLGYNTTNGSVVYAGTNPLSFTNTVFFGSDTSINTSSGINYGGSEVINLEERTLVGDWVVAGGLAFISATNAATTRTNLGLGATWLTNTNVTNFRAAIGLGATNDVTFADITLTESGEDDVSVENASGSIVLRQTTNVLVEFGTGASHLFYNAISFNNTNNAAATRTNLSLGASNTVTFAGLTNNGDITINQTTTNNGLLYIRRTNNEAFLGLANLIASNNVTVSNETLFRVGVSEATNKSAQFGFRNTNTNGEGVAVFSVFGYNALMMIGPSDPAAGTNPIQATVYSVSPTNKVMTLITTNTGAMLMHRPIGIDTAGVSTNAPANTTNVAGWIEFYVGTNSVRVPYYQ